MQPSQDVNIIQKIECTLLQDCLYDLLSIVFLCPSWWTNTESLHFLPRQGLIRDPSGKSGCCPRNIFSCCICQAFRGVLDLEPREKGHVPWREKSENRSLHYFHLLLSTCIYFPYCPNGSNRETWHRGVHVLHMWTGLCSPHECPSINAALCQPSLEEYWHTQTGKASSASLPCSSPVAWQQYEVIVWSCHTFLCVAMRNYCNIL